MMFIKSKYMDKYTSMNQNFDSFDYTYKGFLEELDKDIIGLCDVIDKSELAQKNITYPVAFINNEKHYKKIIADDEEHMKVNDKYIKAIEILLKRCADYISLYLFLINSNQSFSYDIHTWKSTLDIHREKLIQKNVNIHINIAHSKDSIRTNTLGLKLAKKEYDDNGPTHWNEVSLMGISSHHDIWDIIFLLLDINTFLNLRCFASNHVLQTAQFTCIQKAIINNNINNISWCILHNPVWDEEKYLYYSDVRSQKMPINFEYINLNIDENHFLEVEWTYSTFALATSLGNIQILDFLLENDCPVDDNVLLVAKKGIYPLKINNDHKICSNAFEWVFRNLNFSINDDDNQVYIDCFTLAALRGEFEFLKFMHENKFPINSDVLAAAVCSSDLNIIKWLRSINCPYDERVFRCAINNTELQETDFDKYMKIIRWLLTDGCPWE